MSLKSLKSRFDLNTMSFLLVGILIGAVAVFAAMSYDVESGEDVAENLAQVLENQTGQQLDVVNVERDKGMFKVDLRTADNQLSTYYVTNGGSSFTQNLINIGNLRSSVEARNSFRNCLVDRNVRLYGNISQQPTQLQIQALGGSQVVGPIYQDVNNNQSLGEAAQVGITQVPAFYYNGSTLEGVNQLQQVEQFTGCSYQLSEN